MITPPAASIELIGKVVLEKESLAVQDLFDDHQVYFLAQQLDTNSLETGSIIRGIIFNECVQSYTLLASANHIKATLYAIASEQKLCPLFPKKVIEEVETILENPGFSEPSLINLENLAFCTIDGADTRDLDQALYIEIIPSGYRIYYALADAAYYVKPKTHLFNEALKRGASYYLPGLMVPMLPRELSEGLISLNENQIRRAMVFEIDLDSSGVCIKTNLFQARIKSQAKLSFEKVQAFLDAPEKKIIDNSALAKSLTLLQEVGELRLRLAAERSIVRYHRHEVDIKLGKEGFRFTILDSLRSDVEKYNEQLSLLCNIEGARFLKKNGDAHLHPVYRVHPSPPQAQINAFEQLLHALIKIHKLDPELWGWQQNGKKTLADYLKALPLTGSKSGIAQAIHRQAILINVRSSFSEQADIHHGVGADVYARFSSPMREIVGIFLHKEVIEKQSNSSQKLSNQDDDALREQVIKIANRSKDIQRTITHEGNLLVLNQMFQDDLKYASIEDRLRRGTVIGLDSSKIYVLLDNPKIEVKVYTCYLESFLDSPLSISSERIMFYQAKTDKPYVRLGDSVSLYVSEQDKKKGRWVIFFK